MTIPSTSSYTAQAGVEVAAGMLALKKQQQAAQETGQALVALIADAAAPSTGSNASGSFSVYA
jgi:hypothetical protein